MKRNLKSTTNEDDTKHQYYQPSPKMQCDICNTVYYSGHGKRHMNSKRHGQALQLLSHLMNRPVMTATTMVS